MSSIDNCSMIGSNEMTLLNQELNDNMNILMNSRMNKILSIIYAIIIVIIGTIMAIGSLDDPTNNYDQLFRIIITFIALAFLIFLHYDIQRHKRFVLNWQQRCKELIESPMNLNGNSKDYDSLSVTTTVIFNRSYLLNNQLDNLDNNTKSMLNSYRFYVGKHSGNFYLKIGLISNFCFF